MDLAARNVLLHHHNDAKIADFGLSQKFEKGRTTWRLRTKMHLPQRWQSVEGMNLQVFSEKSDVWSYGVTCWEIMTYGRLPYNTVKLAMVKKHVSKGGRLPCPSGYPNSVKYWGIVEKCWEAKPTDRPTFAELVTSMVEAGQDESARGGTHGMRDVGKMLRSTPAADASIYDDAADPNAGGEIVSVPWPSNLQFVWGGSASNPRIRKAAAAP
jgi:serine/threonine protein kinase